MSQYLFESERLQFRFWKTSDIDWFSRMNEDAAVMRHFPSTLTYDESKGFLNRLIEVQEKNGYCYFAVEEKKSGEAIGFIGITNQIYESDFTPAVDIGWRLMSEFWNKGYATEGANAILAVAKKKWNIDQLISVATLANNQSTHVMKKIGMTYVKSFLHPNLKAYPDMQECVLYTIKL